MRISDWSSDVCSSDLDWAQKLGFAPLNRLWQLLLKGHDEVLRANNPLEHLEMLLLRVIYAASMPDPGELAKLLDKGGVPATPMVAPAAPAAQGDTVAALPVDAPAAETPASALDRKSTRLNSSH